ncbi:BZ3500_MvSof-1268-A1-R1_Chr11-2g03410 [Microbotryum saponariae]|uniref:BZ3500_MvSof-1268-A1-R1_Chr11-2g03410 protein n=1 Tax=Microbotryum saponariae TaxID=289078 RepID=A0A2X0KND3_9BASI|nr:BZ3500_MvSof-1268-A1-R1_Chr11-2g03410 [Microbotryum saponariae]SDA03317.1 BZ3501_MvSof-1269-A2-R1_Chr11g02981 [Microbotryum saponariae]
MNRIDDLDNPLCSPVGRLKHFASITSPLTLLASSTELANAQRFLREYQDGVGEGRKAWGKEEEYGLWKKKQLVESSIHPDTGLPVPLPFRLSAFVPTNLLIVGGMLMPNPTIKSVIFWQFANQSLNVAVNYSNANKSISMTNAEIAKAYASATIASCTIAVGLTSLVPRLRSLAPSTRMLLGKLVPFVAVASAGCVNIGLMRWKEIRDGISIYKPKDAVTGRVSDEVLGKSSIAGKYAIGQTAASRVLTNIPTLILPPLIITLLERRGAFDRPNGKRLSTALNLGLIGLSLLVFLPPAIAVFPQRGAVSPKKLEEKYHDLPYDHVEFNKGL